MVASRLLVLLLVLVVAAPAVREVGSTKAPELPNGGTCFVPVTPEAPLPATATQRTVQFEQIAEAAGFTASNGKVLTAPNCLFAEQLERSEKTMEQQDQARPRFVPASNQAHQSHPMPTSPVDTLQDDGMACMAEKMAGGVAIGDFDRDGWADVAMTRLQAPPLLYRNLRNGSFEDVTEATGLYNEFVAAVRETGCLVKTKGGQSPPFHERCRFGSGALAWLDIDNDGDLDLYVTSMGGLRHYLFVNHNGKFTEQAKRRGAQVVIPGDRSFVSGSSIAVADYDHDGYLDMFVAEWRPYLYRDVRYWNAGLSSNSRLLRNRGATAPGFFEDASEEAGLRLVTISKNKFENVARLSRPGFSIIPEGVYTLGPMWIDLDNDGWLDLYLASDFGTSMLWWNNGNGTFTESSDSSGTTGEFNGMGIAAADINFDGFLDVFVTAIYSKDCIDASTAFGGYGNELYRNLGNRTFARSAEQSGVADGQWAWGVQFADIDNDGDEDLYCANGMSIPESTFDDQWNLTPNRLWLNVGPTEPFQSAADTYGVNGLKGGRGVALFDFDHDGDLDIFVLNYADTPYLFRNHVHRMNFVRVQALESVNGRDSIGARVYVGTQMRELAAGGYQSQNELVAHFGLGPDLLFNETTVRVVFPPRWKVPAQTVVVKHVPVNSLLTVIRPPMDVTTATYSAVSTCANAATMQPVAGTHELVGEVFGPPKRAAPTRAATPRLGQQQVGQQPQSMGAAAANSESMDLLLDAATLLGVIQDELKSEVGEPPIDGKANHDGLGAWNTRLRRVAPVGYPPGTDSPIDEHEGRPLPGPRYISNALGAQSNDVFSARRLSDCHAHFGQLLAHDTDHTPTEGNIHVASKASMVIPQGDPVFDPTGTGVQLMRFRRSVFDRETGLNSSVPREQQNRVTSFIDASVVYASVKERAGAVRSKFRGQLITSEPGQLPFNSAGMSNDNPLARPIQQLYLAGDVRVNIQMGLMAMHTLFVREHNFIADQISWVLQSSGAVAGKSDEELDELIYRHARRIVVAEMQAITMNEYLPALLGRKWMRAKFPPYAGYKASVDPSVSTEFSTAAFRFGHSQAGQTFLMVNADGSVNTTLSLKSTYFHPDTMVQHGGVDAALRGMVCVRAQEIDMQVMDDLRNFLFGPVDEGGVDLLATNIMRGRDHGIPPLNTVRAAYGLPKYTEFAQISPNRTLTGGLQALYASIHDVDLFVGGLCEKHIAGGSVGETFATILTEQFIRLRDGDKFWYQNVYSASTVEMIDQITLSAIIRRNVPGNYSLQESAFVVPRGW